MYHCRSGGKSAIRATPDGFVTCTCCGDGLVEIKCPFSVKDSHSDILKSQKGSFLNTHGLIASHKYYTQVQGQLLITEKNIVILWYGHLVESQHREYIKILI